MSNQKSTPAEMERIPVELIVQDTKNKIMEIIRSNGLGTTINRLILQEVREILAIEEQQIIRRLEEEEAKKKAKAMKGGDQT